MTRLALLLVAPLSLLAACSSDKNQACYSPNANLSSAYENGAKGCACKTGADQEVCVKGVALICQNGHWQAVMDGPCMPSVPDSGIRPDGPLPAADGGNLDQAVADAPERDGDVPACYSPANLASAPGIGAKGCTCRTGVDQPVCANGVGLICENDHWLAVKDGPCMPGPVFDAWPETADSVWDRSVADSGLPDGLETGASRDGQSVDAMCIRLADMPSVSIRSDDSPPRRLTLSLVSGPCTVQSDRNTVDFYYWEKGYSCPKLSDEVTCEVQVSSEGASLVVPVTFSVGGYPMTWRPVVPFGSYSIPVRFSAGDAGIDGAQSGG